MLSLEQFVSLMGNHKLLKRTLFHIAQLHDKQPCDNSSRLTSLLPTSVAVNHEACLPPSGMCRRVTWWKSADLSGENTASIVTIQDERVDMESVPPFDGICLWVYVTSHSM